MNDRPHRRPASLVPRRPLAAVLAGASVLALAGLVTVASHGTPVWTSLREGQANRWEILANVALFGGIGLVEALAIALIIHRTLIAGRPDAPPLRTALLRALPVAAVALAALGLLAIAHTPLVTEIVRRVVVVDTILVERRLDSDSAVRRNHRGASGGGFGNRPGGDSTTSGGLPQPAPPLPRTAESDSGNGGGEADVRGLGPILLIMLGALAVAIVGAIVWSRHTRHRTEPARHEDLRDDEAPLPSPPDAATAHGAVARTIDAMLADPDPNTAIIGAYARLLEGLTACDAGRHDHEAPMEHLRRALTTLHVRPEPLHRLIGLFEMARFSSHRLTESHRDQALDALQAAAADLAVAPFPPVTADVRPIEALR